MLSERERWQSYGLEAIERVIVKRMVWREFVEAIRVMKLQQQMGDKWGLTNTKMYTFLRQNMETRLVFRFK
jgi:hypothetical protein